MFKHLIKPRSQNPHPFTDEQISPKAYELWQQRGPDSTSKENWEDAIRALRWEQRRKRVTKPIQRLWWKTGLGPSIRRCWKWTGIPEKTGWDFAQLLAAPIVLALVGWGLNEYAKERDHRQQQADKEKDVLLADNKAKQDTLVKYLDQMADSLKDGLLDAKPGSNQFIVAQSRTVLALQSLDRKRQHLVIQFLRAAGLSNAPNSDFDKWKPGENFPAKSRVLLYNAQMEKANLANSDLSSSVLVGVDLERANLGCDPPNSKDESNCTDLRGADLRGADLTGADLTGADLYQANLQRADLRNADLRGANLYGAFLYEAFLYEANLSFANLRRTTLDKANFRGADLSGADLRGADLYDANFTKTDEKLKQQIQSAKNWQSAYYDPYLCKLLGIPYKEP